MVKLKLFPRNLNHVAEATIRARYTNHLTCDYLTTTQAWEFVSEGEVVGDALVVVAHLGQCYAVIRMKVTGIEGCGPPPDRIEVIACVGIVDAIQRFGGGYQIEVA